MPGSHDIYKENTEDEKRTRPKQSIEPHGEDHMAKALADSDRAPGFSKEYSGWDVYNNEAKKVDMELVKDWTASLNFLLLFAAIFAAVLTAFIIESKKLLEQDTTSIMLDVMIFYTNNVANGTHTPYTLEKFHPSPVAIVVNSLFFASLSASLGAALASVVALQWVADYDAAITRGGSSPEDQAKRRQLRYSGVMSWKMDEIIAALPLLVYISVILFFVGLLIWMQSINQVVGAVIAGGAATAVLFYGVSTLVAVIFVSAPFRTPVVRWIYSLYHLPLSLVHRLASILRPTSSQSRMEEPHISSTGFHKRDDIAIANRGELGRDALVWLARQLSISPDSYRRLLLLVGELPHLNPAHMPSFAPAEASWWSIFDLLGWRHFLNTSAESSAEDRRGMEILQRCHEIPVIQKLISPAVYERDHTEPIYWTQYCDKAESAWNSDWTRPNHLFLLLRDIPRSSQFSVEELEIMIELVHWRNQLAKPIDVWDKVFTNARSIDAQFFNSCVRTFTQYSMSLYPGPFERSKLVSIVKNIVQLSKSRGDVSAETTTSLIQAYEFLLTNRHWSEHRAISIFFDPLFYGERVWHYRNEKETVHDSLLLVLSRNLNTHPKEEIPLRIEEMLQMLFLSPAISIDRDWLHLRRQRGNPTQLHPHLFMEWIKQADRIPDIHEILRNLNKAQSRGVPFTSLWRTSNPDNINDPQFVEALQTFERLMTSRCSDDESHTMIDLLCKDLELGPVPDFEEYFTFDRCNSLVRLSDPCLQIISRCARGVDFVAPVFVDEEYKRRRAASLTRVAEHVIDSYPGSNSPAVLALQASLWSPFCEAALGLNSRRVPVPMARLYRIFRHPVPCARCLDGPGHVLFHGFNGPHFGTWTKAVELQDIKLGYHFRTFAEGLLSMWALNDMDSFDDLLKQVKMDPQPSGAEIQLIQDIFDSLRASEHHMLTLIWNTVVLFERRRLIGNLAVILIGIRKALELPDEPQSAVVLALLARRLASLQHLIPSLTGTRREREVVSREVVNVILLVLGQLATRAITGRLNGRTLACARATWDFPPAVGWLPPYTG